MLILSGLYCHAETIREKTFTGQEILAEWNIFDNAERILDWDGASDDGACITFQGYVILKSVNEYYNVRSVTVAYSGAQYTVYPNPPIVGGIGFESDSDEKSGSPMVSTAPAGTTPSGQIEIMVQSGRRQAVAISSITIVYDTEGAQRDLKWSTASATARLGEPFDAPTLDGKNLEGVSYSSSDKNVAYIDASGNVSVINTGTTTITASAPSSGIWNASSASYKLTVTSSMVTETINVSVPGSLKEQLVDLDTRPQHLILTGKLNSSDLGYIAQGEGKMAGVKALDMSAVTLDYDNGSYNSISGSDGSGIGLGTLTRLFYLSETCHNDTTSSPTGLGGYNTTIRQYSNNLSGLFCNNTTLDSVKLPTSLQEIGSFIFNGSAVSNVSLPDNVTKIPEHAFAGTSKLAVFNSPASITEVGKCAFQNSSIKVFNSSTILIAGDDSFNGSQLEHFDFSALREIGNSAFEGTRGLTGTLDLQNAVALGERCFCGTGFSSVAIGEQIDSIPYLAFSSAKISSVRLPSNLKYIGESAFYACENLSINIPETVVYIGQSAFPSEWLHNQPSDNGVWYFAKVAYQYDDRIAGVETITLKSGIKSVSPGFATDGLRSTLKKLILPDGIEAIGQCNDPSREIAEWRKSCFYNCEKLEEVNLPEGLLTIGDAAFSGCKKLQIEFFPQSLKSIGQSAFSGCEGLYAVTLGKNLTYLGRYAFGCPNISEVKLYSTALTSDGSPFGNSNIEKVTIGANVTNIPNDMFSRCSSLIRLIFEDHDATGPELTFEDGAFKGCVMLKIESLPERTVSVGESAFESVSFGERFSTNNIISIDERAFLRSKGITSLTITSALERCGGGAFSDIESLSEVYYNAPDLDVVKDSYYHSPFLRSSNFKATGITEVTIGPDVNTIPDNLFRYHPNLVSLTFEPQVTQSRAGNSLAIGAYAFRQCNIQSVELPDVRTAIGEQAFSYNHRLKSLRLGDGTENIDRQAFTQCHALASVDVPSSVVSIGEEAFYQFTNQTYPYTPNMTSAYLHFEENPEIGYHAFVKDVKVYVRQNMISDYQSTGAGWNTLVPYAIESFSIDQNSASIEAESAIKLTASIYPSEYSGMDIRWTSSDSAVATVDNNGVVTGVNDGKAVITASIAYMNGFTASCDVTVGNGAGIENVISDIENSDIRIYNMNGIHLGDNVKNLSPGIYIIKRGNSTDKVIIRK